MPSITWWNRLEPRPRSADITEALAARIRDPLWMLARQWQFGEFRGEDAGSPAYVEIATSVAPMLGWRTPGQTTTPLGGAPLEELVETEAFGVDLALRVEVGQTWEALLAKEGAPAAVRDAFRSTYQIALDPEATLAAAPDQEGARFQRVCAGRAPDGVAIYLAILAAHPAAPAPVASLPVAAQPAARNALAALEAWVRDVYDDVGLADAPAWRPERLEYAAGVVITKPDGAVAVLAASPGREADFDWYSLDERPGATDSLTPPAPVRVERRSVLPMHVRFRGMPNHRFWDFESGVMDFGAIAPDTRDLAKLLVIDFMLVQGNDWFVVPVRMDVGSSCRVDSLIVYDVFGGETLVERADREPVIAGERWTMFSTAIEGDATTVSDYFVMTPTAATCLEVGPALEDVRLIRDQMANMAWAVEHSTENGVGESWRGLERDLAVQATTPPPTIGANVPPQDAVPVRYQLQSVVPENWIPLVPVALDPASGEVALERGAMVRAPGGNTFELVLPHGRILLPTRLLSQSYRIREEEVSRAG